MIVGFLLTTVNTFVLVCHLELAAAALVLVGSRVVFGFNSEFCVLAVVICVVIVIIIVVEAVADLGFTVFNFGIIIESSRGSENNISTFDFFAALGFDNSC